jgi:hypothetical protein
VNLTVFAAKTEEVGRELYSHKIKRTLIYLGYQADARHPLSKVTGVMA